MIYCELLTCNSALLTSDQTVSKTLNLSSQTNKINNKHLTLWRTLLTYGYRL